ncbi:hypothetical protein GJ654_18675 [Rhodoblastus acidophilus]|uniref:Uncharacterized protein n=1 Tax=Rhodoblastus acidophilus TaxID=1074 RepID=A0A6N8DRS6_RHOAC|nr:hypothetical protein [Rhodoblastus acidophilus]MCW2276353.1 hypothetical protein [Rhodoblastus acidophilus]MTV33008.1 hypothetical protein [Rhodoblastus acidophilus]
MPHTPTPTEKPIHNHLGAVWLHMRPEMRDPEYIVTRMSADLCALRRKHGHYDLHALLALGWTEAQINEHSAAAIASAIASAMFLSVGVSA